MSPASNANGCRGLNAPPAYHISLQVAWYSNPEVSVYQQTTSPSPAAVPSKSQTGQIAVQTCSTKNKTKCPDILDRGALPDPASAARPQPVRPSTAAPIPASASTSHIMADPMDDSFTEDVWTSPGPEGRGAPSDQPKTPRTPNTPKTPKTPANQNSTFDREASLRKELEGVRNINAAIEGIINTLDKAKGNMNVGIAAG